LSLLIKIYKIALLKSRITPTTPENRERSEWVFRVMVLVMSNLIDPPNYFSGSDKAQSLHGNIAQEGYFFYNHRYARLQQMKTQQ